MAKNVELTDLVITELRIDYGQQVVDVTYVLVDANGKEWDKQKAYFWVTFPPLLPGQEQPENWFLLPPSYIPTLLGLRDDADAALTAKFLV